MFAKWGHLVYRLRFAVIGAMVAGMLALGAYGLGLEDHLSQSGFDDPGSESVQASKLTDKTYGRDTAGDVVAIYTAPDGKTVDDPEFSAKITQNLNSLVADHPEQIAKINASYWKTDKLLRTPILTDKSKQHGLVSFAIQGANDTELTKNFRDVRSAFDIDGVNVQLAGLQPVAGTLNDTMGADVRRMELLAIPAVGVLLFFIFGGVIAAALPLICGGLTVIGAWGIVRLITNFTEVNTFVSPVVSLIGLGLAIDYGLFIVSRFREELAEGYDTRAAVRRSVMTAGRTVIFSATMIVASLGGLLLFPQGFLKSVAYGAIATVSLAAITAITVLPAILGILGPRVDAFGLKIFRKTRSADEIENSIWGRLTKWVMKHPLRVTIPIVVGLLLLIIPVSALQLGGINEKYLPPNNPTRVAQEELTAMFPTQTTEPIKLVITDADSAQVGPILTAANSAPGIVGKFAIDKSGATTGVWVLKASLVDRNDSRPTIDYLRAIDKPDGVKAQVAGTPAIEQDSIAALTHKLPLMILLVVLSTTILMFLTFGSLVLPIKAALMSALGLGSTLGILTWIFVDGHGAGLLNFTPGPIMAPVLVLIIAIIYGLSTDYEVFLLSRMVEARAMGASTTEAVRIGTAHTGRIITAAALILIVVTGAFGFSELVMMQYIAYGMIAALIIDATLIRMFLVPATMKLLGDDCWWAPQWMKRLQEKIGLAEPLLDDERIGDVPDLALADPRPPSDRPRSPVRVREPLTQPIPRYEADRLKAKEPPAKKPSDRDPDVVENWLSDLRSPVVAEPKAEQPRSAPMPVAPKPPAPKSPAPEAAPAQPNTPAPEKADRRANTEDPEDSGRHRAGSGALSVSELIERQNRH